MIFWLLAILSLLQFAFASDADAQIDLSVLVPQYGVSEDRDTALAGNGWPFGREPWAPLLTQHIFEGATGTARLSTLRFRHNGQVEVLRPQRFAEVLEVENEDGSFSQIAGDENKMRWNETTNSVYSTEVSSDSPYSMVVSGMVSALREACENFATAHFVIVAPLHWGGDLRNFLSSHVI